jgi:hypothetical protein
MKPPTHLHSNSATPHFHNLLADSKTSAADPNQLQDKRPLLAPVPWHGVHDVKAGQPGHARTAGLTIRLVQAVSDCWLGNLVLRASPMH